MTNLEERQLLVNERESIEDDIYKLIKRRCAIDAELTKLRRDAYIEASNERASRKD